MVQVKEEKQAKGRAIGSSKERLCGREGGSSERHQKEWLKCGDARLVWSTNLKSEKHFRKKGMVGCVRSQGGPKRYR